MDRGKLDAGEHKESKLEFRRNTVPMWALTRGIEVAIAAKRMFRMSQVERVCS